jgi:hypothetical protein
MKSILLLAAILISANLMAQKKNATTVDQDIQAIEQEYAQTKKDMLSDFMQLSGDKATAFWSVYDGYEAERTSLARKKFDLIVDYAANYQALTADKADELVNATFDTNMDYEKMNQKYYNQMKKAIGVLDAARFTQFETYLQSLVQGQIQDELPFIGEIEKSKKKNK